MEKFYISKLSDDIINKIGSTIYFKNPSCILKELLENSLDAFSKKIIIYIENIGLKNIKIIDDGIGIHKNDLNKMYLRYNTSKISNINDLQTFKTYGFRGESLFFINSISKLSIISKTCDQKNAYKIDCFKNNNNIELSSIPSNSGTVIEIKDLFCNSINYKNFLENLDIEYNNIFLIFKYISLSNFNVHFVLYIDNKQIFNLPFCNDDYSKIKRLELLSNNLKYDNIINIKAFKEKIALSGFIFFFKTKKNKKKFNFFYINNRIVNSNIIDNIFFDIFKLRNKKFLNYTYCLYLELDYPLYTILFSQNKMDVYFKDYFFVYNYLLDIILNELINSSFYKEIIIFKKDEQIDLSLQGLKQFYCTNLNNRKLLKSNDGILSVLNNSDVFFKIKDILYFIKLNVIRSKCISNLFFFQYLKYNKILSKKILFFKFLNFTNFSIFLSFKKFLNIYGFKIEIFNKFFLIIRSIPILLYNLLVDWDNLFFELKLFLEKNFDKIFSINKINFNIINIFIKNIYEKSECNLYESKFFYEELLNSKNNEFSWFKKNCFEVSLKKIID